MVAVSYKRVQVFLLVYCIKHQTVEAETLDTSLYVIEKLGQVSEGTRAWIKLNTFSRFQNCSNLENGYRGPSCPQPVLMGIHAERCIYSSSLWTPTAEETAFMKLQASFLFLDMSTPSERFLFMGWIAAETIKVQGFGCFVCLRWEWRGSFCSPIMAIFFLLGCKCQLRSGTFSYCVKTG